MQPQSKRSKRRSRKQSRSEDTHEEKNDIKWNIIIKNISDIAEALNSNFALLDKI